MADVRHRPDGAPADTYSRTLAGLLPLLPLGAFAKGFDDRFVASVGYFNFRGLSDGLQDIYVRQKPRIVPIALDDITIPIPLQPDVAAFVLRQRTDRNVRDRVVSHQRGKGEPCFMVDGPCDAAADERPERGWVQGSHRQGYCRFHLDLRPVGVRRVRPTVARPIEPATSIRNSVDSSRTSTAGSKPLTTLRLPHW